jgi:hypothetical protein
MWLSIRTKGQQTVQTCLAALKVKFLSKIYVELQATPVTLQVLQELHIV